jgi:cell division protein FtsI (penicillin-binding protein 3)
VRDDREKWARMRLRFVGGLFSVVFAITAGRACYLQIYKRDFLQKEAERQHQRVVQLTPARGTIYDRNHAELAVSIEMDSCYAEPRSLENIDEAAGKLAPLIGLDRETVKRKLQGNRNFVWLQRRITPEQVARLKDLELAGIGFVKETKRFYPNSEIASHVIGFTGLDPEGLEGVERRYDAAILGTAGYLVTERDALGRDMALKGNVVKGSSNGHSVTLTIDRNIQHIAERELAKAVIESRAKGGVAIVMEPGTGKVLAMANYPAFNPNAYQKYQQQQLRNRSITDSYEPGSTFKVFLIAAALEEKVVRPTDSFNCEMGKYNIGGRTIHDTHSYGQLSVGDILKYSSNIGSAKIGSRLGSERLYSYLKSFGFGDRSAIDLPGEVGGSLRRQQQWYGVDLATISFGQGVTATALQVTTAIAAIANGGELMRPYVVERITDDQGTVIQQQSPQVRNRVISPTTAQTIARMMEGVTVQGGTGMNAAIDGYRVAGKTGTSQKVDPVTRTYSVDKRVASFVGFVPLQNPKMTIMVVVDEPKTSVYGGIVAAPAFRAIAEQSLRYLNVPLEVKPKERPKTIEVKTQEPAVAATEEMVADGGDLASGEGTRMPDFRRLSMRQVLQTMEKQGVNVKIIGSGRVVEQSPLPGKTITPTDQVWVKLMPSA